MSFPQNQFSKSRSNNMYWRQDNFECVPQRSALEITSVVRFPIWCDLSLLFPDHWVKYVRLSNARRRKGWVVEGASEAVLTIRWAASYTLTSPLSSFRWSLWLLYGRTVLTLARFQIDFSRRGRAGPFFQLGFMLFRLKVDILSSRLRMMVLPTSSQWMTGRRPISGYSQPPPPAESRTFKCSKVYFIDCSSK